MPTCLINSPAMTRRLVAPKPGELRSHQGNYVRPGRPNHQHRHLILAGKPASDPSYQGLIDLSLA